MKTLTNSPAVICDSLPVSGKRKQNYNLFKFFKGLQKCVGFILFLLPPSRKCSASDFFSMKLNAIFSLCNLFFFQKQHQDSISYSRGWTIRRFSMFSAFILLIGLNGLGQCGPFQIYESFGTQALPTQGGTWAQTSIGFSTSATARTGLYGLNFNAVGDLIRTPQIANPGVLSFWYKRTSATTAWTLNVQTSPDNSTWTTRGTVSSPTTTAQQYTIDIGALSLTNVYIRLIDARASGTDRRDVDDLSITSTTAASNTILVQGQSCTPTLTAGTTYTIYDRGGVNDEYSSSQTTAPMVLTASSGNPVINITTLSTESSADFVKLYNGNSTAATALHTGTGFSGSTAPGSFTATGTSLTLDFTSDGSINGGGFVATLTMPAISPTLTLANPTTAISATNICASSTAVTIHAFNITGSNGGGTLTNFSFTTTGSYLSTDVSNFKILYNSSNTISGATTLATLNTPGIAGAKTFTAFSQAIGNATGYFWITMDVASGATNNGTITVSASATSGADMTTTVTKAGTAAASGAQTLKATPTSSAGAAQTVCSTATMAATSPTVGTGAWTLTSGQGTITTSSANNSGLTALGIGANVFTWTVSNSTCTAATSTVTITGTATPTPTFTAQAGATACGNTDVTYTTQTGMTNYTWTYSGTLNTDYSITSGGGTSSNTVTLKWLTSGNKTVTINYTNVGGCAAGSATSSTTTAVTLQPTLTSLSYAASPFCTSVASGTATLVGTNTPTGGTYSSTTGLTINSSTGAVTTNSSTAGTYTVTYTKAAGVCNAASTTASVTITTLPTASISYAGTPFCASVTSASPSLTGTAGGTYSSTAGLSITGSTGVVVPSTSTVGAYTVTYTVSAAGGCSAVTATTSVSVVTTPAITTNPINKTVVAGGNTTMTTVASNTPTSYTWQVSTDGGTSWNTISNGGVYTTATAASLTITGATFTMNGYKYKVSATNGCGTSSYSTVATLTVNYCTPVSSGNSYYINNFSTTNGVTNITNNSTTTSVTSAGYSNYSSTLSCSQYANTSISWSATTNASLGAGFALYVDWNNDGSFVTGERMYTSNSTSVTSTGTQSFTVPSGTAVGNYRMRLVLDYNVANPLACPASGSIEAEDYTFTVTAACSSPTTQATTFTYSNIEEKTMTLGWTRGNGNNVMIVAKEGSAPTDPTSGTTYTADAAYGSGTACGGGFVVYSGTGASVDLTSLLGNKTYNFAAYEYSTTGTCYNLTQLTGSSTTLDQETWVGGTSNAWATAANWSSAYVPLATTNVTIPSGTTYAPSTPLSSVAYAKNLTINSGATLTVTNTASALFIGGNLICNGTISNTGTSYIEFKGGTSVDYATISGTGTMTTASFDFGFNANTFYKILNNITINDLYLDNAYPGSVIDMNGYDITTYYLAIKVNSIFYQKTGTLSIEQTAPTINNAAFVEGTGTTYFSKGTTWTATENQTIPSITYYNLKVRTNNGYTSTIGDGGALTVAGDLTILNPSTAGGIATLANNVTVTGNTYLGTTVNALTLTIPALYRIIGTGTFTMGNVAAHAINIEYTSASNFAITCSGTPTFYGTVTYTSATAQKVITANSYNNLILALAGTKTLFGALDVNGNLTLTAGTFDVSTFNVNLAGDFVKQTAATFTANTAIFTFDGTIAQYVNVTAAAGTTACNADITFYNLVINGSDVKIYYNKTNDRKYNTNDFTVNSGKQVSFISQ